MIATNPDPDSRLPYVIRVPYGDGLVFRAGDTWPREPLADRLHQGPRARQRGLKVSERGRIARSVVDAFWAASPGRRSSGGDQADLGGQ